MKITQSVHDGKLNFDKKEKLLMNIELEKKQKQKSEDNKLH